MGGLVHFDRHASWGETRVCDELITRDLARAGLSWGRWDVEAAAAASKPQQLLQKPSHDLAVLRDRFALRRIERLRLSPTDSHWPALRRQFVAEHASGATEVRCFVEGAGLFYIRVDDGFLGLLCEAGEWVGLPPGTRHSFDAGDAPELDALRLFSDPEGFAARHTGAAPHALPSMDDFVSEMLRLTGHAADLEE